VTGAVNLADHVALSLVETTSPLQEVASMKVEYRWLSPSARSENTDAPLPDWPQDVLDRHQAKILKPAEVTRGQIADLRSTVYRTSFLLITERVIASPEFDAIVRALAEIRIGVVAPPLLGRIVPQGELREHLLGLPRPVRLVEVAGGPPVDAWVALQHLRQTVGLLADEVGLEHLMAGAVLGYGGVPTYDPNQIGGRSADGDSFPHQGRSPVRVAGRPPWRDPAFAQRRPVVAVLDTGVRQHPWFGAFGTVGTPQNTGFLRLFTPAQEAIAAQQWRVAGLPQSEILSTHHDDPVFVPGLGQTVFPASGHGTFIAGIVHQHAPEADVLMVRVLWPDNIGHEGDVLLALWLLYARVLESRKPGREHEMVDIVSCSLGYYAESSERDRDIRLKTVIDALIKEGVVVVAAAGNEATGRAFFPAALATLEPLPPEGEPVMGVGALNPNSTTAWFSNGGPSATWLAPGARVVSIYPADVKGSSGSKQITHDRRRASYDPDDFSAGFAVWDGTSFAAPLLAAMVANELIAFGTNTVDKDAALARAADAIKTLKAGSQ
jgi:hypothetical protein